MVVIVGRRQITFVETDRTPPGIVANNSKGGRMVLQTAM